MVENEIPFPLLNGMTVEIMQSGTPTYYTIIGQGTPFELSTAYALAPTTVPTLNQLVQFAFIINGLNAMRTMADELKIWVSWIDNQFLTAEWYINSTVMQQLNGVATPLTFSLSPYGSKAMPMGIINSPTANVTVTLGNSSPAVPIEGTFRLKMYYYRVKLLGTTMPNGPYTSLDYVAVEPP